VGRLIVYTGYAKYLRVW